MIEPPAKMRDGSRQLPGLGSDRMRKVTVAATGLIVLLMNPVPADAQQGEPLRWSITPYVWVPTTRVDAAADDTTIGGTIRVKDVIDSIDAAFIGSAEVGAGRWSAFADLMLVDASDATERNLLSIRARNRQQFVDIALSWWPTGINAPLSVFGGLRYTRFDSRVDVIANQTGTTLISGRSDTAYTDMLLGARYRIGLSDRWSLLTRGDVSFGDSEGTFMVRANLAYAVGKHERNRILFGYQYKQADFDDGALETAFKFSGIVAGFSFNF